MEPYPNKYPNILLFVCFLYRTLGDMREHKKTTVPSRVQWFPLVELANEIDESFQGLTSAAHRAA